MIVLRSAVPACDISCQGNTGQRHHSAPRSSPDRPLSFQHSRRSVVSLLGRLRSGRRVNLVIASDIHGAVSQTLNITGAIPQANKIARRARVESPNVRTSLSRDLSAQVEVLFSCFDFGMISGRNFAYRLPATDDGIGNDARQPFQSASVVVPEGGWPQARTLPKYRCTDFCEPQSDTQ